MKKCATMLSRDFNKLIDEVKDFVSKSATRKIHEYIKLEFKAEEKKVVAVAVDGYRLATAHASLLDCENDFVAYVRSGVKLAGKDSCVRFELSKKELVIRCDGFIFGYEQPEGVFLDWEKVIPQKEPTYKIAFNGDYMLAALKAAKISCGGIFRSHVVLEFRSNIEPIILRTNGEDIKMVLPIRIKE